MTYELDKLFLELGHPTFYAAAVYEIEDIRVGPFREKALNVKRQL